MIPLRISEEVCQVPSVHLAVTDYRHACVTCTLSLVGTCKLGIRRLKAFVSTAMRFGLSTFVCVLYCAYVRPDVCTVYFKRELWLTGLRVFPVAHHDDRDDHVHYQHAYHFVGFSQSLVSCKRIRPWRGDKIEAPACVIPVIDSTSYPQPFWLKTTASKR